MAFDGLRVLVLESRRARELATLVTTYGGEPISAPSMREVPLESNTEALAFADRLDISLKSISKVEELAPKIDVPPERRFVGFNAYQDVIACCVRGLSRAAPSLLPLCAMCRCPSG